MKKILIIGGTGYIGYNLAKLLLRKNWSVTVISVNRPNRNRYIKKVKYIKCNISKKKDVFKKIKEKFYYVVNLGGYVDHINKKNFLYSFFGC